MRLNPTTQTLQSIIVFSCFALSFTASSALASPASELLSRSIAHHDPQGLWQTAAIELTLSGGRPDREERVETKLAFNHHCSTFSMSGRFREAALEYRLENGKMSATVNGSADYDAETGEKMLLSREDGQFWQNYHGFLLGLPMNLTEAHVQLGEQVASAEFAGRQTQSITVQFDPDVGSDVWTFYFDPDTAALVGCRFVKQGASSGGEYIVFEDVTESNGLILPKSRKWYMNDDQRYLGEDLIVFLRAKS